MRDGGWGGGSKDVPGDLFLALSEPERTEIDIFEEFGDGHEIDEAIAFFATKGLVAEALCEQEMRYQSVWVCFDDGKDEDWEQDITGDG